MLSMPPPSFKTLQIPKLDAEYSAFPAALYPFCLGHSLCLKEAPTPRAILTEIFDRKAKKQSDHSIRTPKWRVVFYQNTLKNPLYHLSGVREANKLYKFIQENKLSADFHTPPKWILYVTDATLKVLHIDQNSPFGRYAKDRTQDVGQNFVLVTERCKLKKSKNDPLTAHQITELAKLVFHYRVDPLLPPQLENEKFFLLPAESCVKSWETGRESPLTTLFHNKALRYQQGFLRTTHFKCDNTNQPEQRAVMQFEYKACLQGIVEIIKTIAIYLFAFYITPKVASYSKLPTPCVLSIEIVCMSAAVMVLTSYLAQAWFIARNWHFSGQGEAGFMKLRKIYPFG